MTFSINAESNF